MSLRDEQRQIGYKKAKEGSHVHLHLALFEVPQHLVPLARRQLRRVRLNDDLLALGLVAVRRACLLKKFDELGEAGRRFDGLGEAERRRDGKGVEEVEKVERLVRDRRDDHVFLFDGRDE